MIEIEVNNRRFLELTQDKNIGEDVLLTTYDNQKKPERRDYISAGDMVMLLNYYRHVKENNIKCDFINPEGV